MTTYLIVGGAGFIGSHLTRLLVRQGKEVHVVVRNTTNRDRLSPVEGEVGVHVANLDDVNSLQGIFSEVRPEVVVHLATTTRPLTNVPMFEDARCALQDVAGFLNVLAAAEHSTRPPALFIRAGSLAEYGHGPHPFRENQREEPVTSYGAGMTSATHFSDVLQPELSFPLINARLALVYGPGQSKRFLLPLLVENCLQGETTRVKYPDERRDLIHIDDVTSALTLLTNKPPVSHRTINIATGQAPTMREVAELVLEYTKASESTVRFGSGTSPHGVADLVGSTELMKELYGWSAQIGIREGILRLIRSTGTEVQTRDGAIA